MKDRLPSFVFVQMWSSLMLQLGTVNFYIKKSFEHYQTPAISFSLVTTAKILSFMGLFQAIIIASGRQDMAMQQNATFATYFSARRCCFDWPWKHPISIQKHGCMILSKLHVSWNGVSSLIFALWPKSGSIKSIRNMDLMKEYNGHICNHSAW